MSHCDSMIGICYLGRAERFKMHLRCSKVNSESELSASLRETQNVLLTGVYYVCFLVDTINLSPTAAQHTIGDNVDLIAIKKLLFEP